MKIHKIYLKQLSFDVPEAPGVFTRNLKPHTSVHIEMGSHRLNKEIFEVELTIKVNMLGVQAGQESEATEGEAEESTIYSLYLVEGGIFELDEARTTANPEAMVEKLIAEGGAVLHPYARADIDSTLVRSGFPPLALSNFDYRKMLQKSTAGKKRPGLKAKDSSIIIH